MTIMTLLFPPLLEAHVLHSFYTLALTACQCYISLQTEETDRTDGMSFPSNSRFTLKLLLQEAHWRCLGVVKEKVDMTLNAVHQSGIKECGFTK